MTAPKVRPRTSWRWLIQPKTRIGAIAIVEAADSLAQNRPSGAEKEAMKAVSGAALEAVRLRLQNASFQHRMIESSAVEAMPGSDSGRSSSQTSCFGLRAVHAAGLEDVLRHLLEEGVEHPDHDRQVHQRVDDDQAPAGVEWRRVSRNDR